MYAVNQASRIRGEEKLKSFEKTKYNQIEALNRLAQLTNGGQQGLGSRGHFQKLKNYSRP